MTDKNRSGRGACYAVIGNLTLAQRAQRALSGAAIQSRLDKSKTSSGRNGCIWSVRIACEQYENARSVLTDANIRVMSWEIENDIF